MSPRDRTTPPRAAADIIVLCVGPGPAGLFRVAFDASGARHTSLLARGVDLRAIRVGDVTGDGVDDVVARQGDGGAQTLVTYRQCTSREAASCKLAAPEAAGGAP